MAVAATGCAALAATTFVAPSGHQTREVSTPSVKQLRSSGAPSGSSSSLPLGVLGAALGVSAAAASVRRSQTRNLRTETCAFENELGVQAPIGFWDPAGFTSDGDQIEFFRRRCVELKHGRVSMLACIGYIVPELAGRWPGYLSPSSKIAFADIPNGLAAVTKVPGVGWFQATVFCGLCELWIAHQDGSFEGGQPGKLRTRFYGGDFFNYEYGSLGIPGYLGGKSLEDPDTKKTKLNAELANGRLAMMAIIGMFFQDGLTGSAWGDWANYTSSPLRAFENELGVQAPAGFWDPLGFTKSGDAASFRRRRYVELKHGRVSMLACLGYISAYYYRFPGEVSPSLGLKFSDVPNGLGAFTKLPFSGWAQMIAFAGTVELFQYVDDPSRAPGDFENAGFLGIPNGYLKIADPEARAKKLSAEIANGRLAMMAIIGMFFQDGLTGEAWGDWSLYTESPLRAKAGYTYDVPDWMEAAPSMPDLATENDDIVPVFPAYKTDKTPETCPQDCIRGTGGPFPENYWDPAGLSKNKTREEILMLRAQELKHGRVAMIASLGWFHVAAGWHFIGDFANGKHGSDNPLIALQEIPFAGCLQVVFSILCLEWLTTYIIKPPAEKPWDVIGWSDIIGDEQYPPWKQAQLQELNNGRLAMLAIIGLIAADLFTDGAQFGQQIGQRCFGNEICADFYQPFASDNGLHTTYPVPQVPYKAPILYPGQVRLATGLPLL